MSQTTNRIGTKLSYLALSYVPECDLGKMCNVYQWPPRISAETDIVRELVKVHGGVEVDLLFFTLTGTYQLFVDGHEFGGRWN